MNLTCLFNPLDCAGSYLDALPWFWLLGIGAVIGLLLGAWLGKWGVVLLFTAGLAFLFLRRDSDDNMAENVDGEDAKPSPRPGKPTGDNWFERIRRGEKVD